MSGSVCGVTALRYMPWEAAPFRYTPVTNAERGWRAPFRFD